MEPWPNRSPSTRKKIREIRKLGTVVMDSYLMWSMTFTPDTVGARTVVSEMGESLSPKRAPTMTAPAAMGAGTPSPAASPIRATPTVLMVPQEVPVMMDMIAHSTHPVTRKKRGEMSLRPQ